MAILTCKQTCECISLQIFSKYPIKKSWDRTNPPDLPTLKAYPTPGVCGRFRIFSLKWRERMNLKVPGAILPLGCAILSTRVKTIRGVGTTPLRRTRVNDAIYSWDKIWKKQTFIPFLYVVSMLESLHANYCCTETTLIWKSRKKKNAKCLSQPNSQEFLLFNSYPACGKIECRC